MSACGSDLFPRDQNRVVLILTEGDLAFGFQHTHNAEWKISHSNGLINRFGAEQQLISDRAPDYRDAGDRSSVGLGEERSACLNVLI
jgi:hypothetical protein